MFIYQKKVDRSTLCDGFSIPSNLQSDIHAAPGGPINFGEIRMVEILLEGESYQVRLKNQRFDKNKWDKHKDVLQIRYSRNSPFAIKLRQIFSYTWDYVSEIKSLPKNKNRKLNIHIPEIVQEYLVIRSTAEPNVFRGDCLTSVGHSHTSAVKGNNSSVVNDDSLPDINTLAKDISELKHLISEHHHSIDELKNKPVTITITNANIGMAAESTALAAPIIKQRSTPSSGIPDFSQLTEKVLYQALFQLQDEQYMQQGQMEPLIMNGGDWFYVGRILYETGYFRIDFFTALEKLLKKAEQRNEAGHVVHLRNVVRRTTLSRESMKFDQPSSSFFSADPLQQWHVVAGKFSANELLHAQTIASRFVQIVEQLK